MISGAIILAESLRLAKLTAFSMRKRIGGKPQPRTNCAVDNPYKFPPTMIHWENSGQNGKHRQMIF
jgi:hypothetical protein